MSFSDRAYNRTNNGNNFIRQFGGGGFGSQSSMVKWLIGINIVVFFLDGVLLKSGRGNPISPATWGNFNIAQAVQGLQVWRFFTYQFIHAGFMHILFNMFGLYFFGKQLEQWWGSKRFLAFYLLCGSSGAVLYTLLAMIPGFISVSSHSMLIGASGSIFGILAASAVLYPHQRVMLLFPPIPMSMRTMALFFLGLAALNVLADGQNAGGQAAHLGGAILGYFLIGRPRLLNFANNFKTITPNKVANVIHEKRQAHQQEKAHQEELFVDQILDKVKLHGLQSLTEKEKRALQNATERQRKY